MQIRYELTDDRCSTDVNSKRIIANKAKKSDAMIMSSIVLLLIYVESTHVMANKMHGLVDLKLELILTKSCFDFLQHWRDINKLIFELET